MEIYSVQSALQEAEVEVPLHKYRANARGMTILHGKYCPSCKTSLAMRNDSRQHQSDEEETRGEDNTTIGANNAPDTTCQAVPGAYDDERTDAPPILEPLRYSSGDLPSEDDTTTATMYSSSQHPNQPVPGVPFCVQCHAHVISDPAQVQLLLSNATENQHDYSQGPVAHKGAILVATPSSLSDPNPRTGSSQSLSPLNEEKEMLIELYHAATSQSNVKEEIEVTLCMPDGEKKMMKKKTSKRIGSLLDMTEEEEDKAEDEQQQALKDLIQEDEDEEETKECATVAESSKCLLNMLELQADDDCAVSSLEEASVNSGGCFTPRKAVEVLMGSSLPSTDSGNNADNEGSVTNMPRLGTNDDTTVEDEVHANGGDRYSIPPNPERIPDLLRALNSSPLLEDDDDDDDDAVESILNDLPLRKEQPDRQSMVTPVLDALSSTSDQVFSKSMMSSNSGTQKTSSITNPDGVVENISRHSPCLDETRSMEVVRELEGIVRSAPEDNSGEESNFLPDYAERRDLATKVLGAKMLQGYALKEDLCLTCSMPLMSFQNKMQCVVCPYLQKRARKLKAQQEHDEEARSLEEQKRLIEEQTSLQRQLLQKGQKHGCEKKSTAIVTKALADSPAGEPSGVHTSAVENNLTCADVCDDLKKEVDSTIPTSIHTFPAPSQVMGQLTLETPSSMQVCTDNEKTFTRELPKVGENPIEEAVNVPLPMSIDEPTSLGEAAAVSPPASLEKPDSSAVPPPKEIIDLTEVEEKNAETGRENSMEDKNEDTASVEESTGSLPLEEDKPAVDKTETSEPLASKGEVPCPKAVVEDESFEQVKGEKEKEKKEEDEDEDERTPAAVDEEKGGRCLVDEEEANIETAPTFVLDLWEAEAYQMQREAELAMEKARCALDRIKAVRKTMLSRVPEDPMADGTEVALAESLKAPRQEEEENTEQSKPVDVDMVKIPPQEEETAGPLETTHAKAGSTDPSKPFDEETQVVCADSGIETSLSLTNQSSKRRERRSLGTPRFNLNGNRGSNIRSSSSVSRSVSELQMDFESKRALVSNEIGKRMMRGWTLLDRACPVCVMPLMTDSAGTDELCVLCGLVGKLGDSKSISLAATDTYDESTLGTNDPPSFSGCVSKKDAFDRSTPTAAEDAVPTVLPMTTEPVLTRIPRVEHKEQPIAKEDTNQNFSDEDDIPHDERSAGKGTAPVEPSDVENETDDIKAMDLDQDAAASMMPVVGEDNSKQAGTLDRSRPAPLSLESEGGDIPRVLAFSNSPPKTTVDPETGAEAKSSPAASRSSRDPEADNSSTGKDKSVDAKCSPRVTLPWLKDIRSKAGRSDPPANGEEKPKRKPCIEPEASYTPVHVPKVTQVKKSESIRQIPSDPEEEVIQPEISGPKAAIEENQLPESDGLIVVEQKTLPGTRGLISLGDQPARPPFTIEDEDRITATREKHNPDKSDGDLAVIDIDAIGDENRAPRGSTPSTCPPDTKDRFLMDGTFRKTRSADDTLTLDIPFDDAESLRKLINDARNNEVDSLTGARRPAPSPGMDGSTAPRFAASPASEGLLDVVLHSASSNSRPPPCPESSSRQWPRSRRSSPIEVEDGSVSTMMDSVASQSQGLPLPAAFRSETAASPAANSVPAMVQTTPTSEPRIVDLSSHTFPPIDKLAYHNAVATKYPDVFVLEAPPVYSGSQPDESGVPSSGASIGSTALEALMTRIEDAKAKLDAKKKTGRESQSQLRDLIANLTKAAEEMDYHETEYEMKEETN